jgi:hypothetical protein
MIDIEQEIFKRISIAVKAQYADAIIYGEYVKAPTAFPALMITEIGNTTFQNGQDSEEMENYTIVAYQVDIFANEGNKKQTCKNIAQIVDAEMLGLKFTRGFFQPISNEQGITIYHTVSRYEAVVSKDYRIYSI